tara:strand:- start:136 stop:870 length:735 start_codon:yes stop_codon:yes gene_type:complete
MNESAEIKNLHQILESFDHKLDQKYKLIVILGLLGDFDSFEYAINLNKFSNNNQTKDLGIYAIAIGNKEGKEKFCKYTGMQRNQLKTVNNNLIHNSLGLSQGIDIGLGGWTNMLLMLSGVNSPKTLKEVLRGYTGDKSASKIYDKNDNINLLNFFKFSGNLFRRTFGDSYLAPFELATFRLNNMIEIIYNWNDYIIDTKYLPQRGATFLLNENNEIIYKYYSKDVLCYSEKMSSPLHFITEFIK